jgi:toxin YoeB
MNYQITLENQALKDINYFKKCDKVILKKIHNLLLEIAHNPFEGIGKPEALKFELSGYWSRRVTIEHRLVYRVIKKQVFVISCRHHY